MTGLVVDENLNRDVDGALVIEFCRVACARALPIGGKLSEC